MTKYLAPRNDRRNKRLILTIAAISACLFLTLVAHAETPDRSGGVRFRNWSTIIKPASPAPVPISPPAKSTSTVSPSAPAVAKSTTAASGTAVAASTAPAVAKTSTGTAKTVDAPPPPPAHLEPLRRGMTLFKKRQYDKALGYFLIVLKLDPANPTAVYYQRRAAEAMWESERSSMRDETLALLKKGLNEKEKASLASILCESGNKSLTEGLYIRAKETFRKVLELAPTEQCAKTGLVKAELALIKDREAAAETASVSTPTAPGSTSPVSGIQSAFLEGRQKGLAGAGGGSGISLPSLPIKPSVGLPGMPSLVKPSAPAIVPAVPPPTGNWWEPTKTGASAPVKPISPSAPAATPAANWWDPAATNASAPIKPLSPSAPTATEPAPDWWQTTPQAPTPDQAQDFEKTTAPSMKAKARAKPRPPKPPSAADVERSQMEYLMAVAAYMQGEKREAFNRVSEAIRLNPNNKRARSLKTRMAEESTTTK